MSVTMKKQLTTRGTYTVRNIYRAKELYGKDRDRVGDIVVLIGEITVGGKTIFVSYLEEWLDRTNPATGKDFDYRPKWSDELRADRADVWLLLD